MRLAFLTPLDPNPRHWPYGGGVASLRLARAMAARGHDVHFFTGHPEPDMTSVEGQLTFHYSWLRQKLPFYDSFRGDHRNVKAFKREHRRAPFDAVLCRGSHLFTLLKPAASCLRTFQLDDLTRLEQRFFPQDRLRLRTTTYSALMAHFDRSALHSADLVFAVTRVGCQEVKSLYPRIKTECIAVPNSIDTVWFEGKPSTLDHRLNPPIFMYFGLGPTVVGGRRDLELFFEAYSLVRSEHPETVAFLLRISEDETARLSKKYDVPCRVANNVPLSQLVEVYDHAVALVMPAHREGFCLPLVESAARGTPAIYSNEPHMWEVADGTRAGLVVDGFVAADWANAMKSLLSDHQAWTRMSVAGRSLAERYTATRVAERVEEVLYSRR
jgi:glycosyltransferase involved in cell wall biosynthesis